MRRRVSDIGERTDEFRLKRDKLLLALGMGGIVVIIFASIFIGVKNEALALAALTACAGLLGAPTVLRLDERKRDGA